ncbi:unnamed protein product [Orchesella dallaii]|uniref:Transmembrane protein n=1 Tax=Orchesella dallaii TaxID=48710 RepID=A0ABP1QHV5_9HEXA
MKGLKRGNNRIDNDNELSHRKSHASVMNSSCVATITMEVGTLRFGTTWKSVVGYLVWFVGCFMAAGKVQKHIRSNLRGKSSCETFFFPDKKKRKVVLGKGNKALTCSS